MPLSSSNIMDSTSAGAKALITNCAGSSAHLIISTRSPPISLDTLCTREPRIPTHAPTGSILLSCERTEIFARKPGSRAALNISIMPSPASGTSKRKSFNTISEVTRSNTSCGPRLATRTSIKIARIRSP